MEKGKNVAVYCGSRYGINPAHTAFAGMAGELLAKNGYTMIYGGGSVGLMGIAADAALAAGGKVVGIIPEVFIAAEQAHRLITELIEVPDLMARKRKMIEAGDAFLILPGGFGTLEEFADTAVHYHIYTEETNRPPIIIANIEGIYDPLRALFENWKSAEFITADEWENIHFISSIKELLPLLPSKGNSLRLSCGRHFYLSGFRCPQEFPNIPSHFVFILYIFLFQRLAFHFIRLLLFTIIYIFSDNTL